MKNEFKTMMLRQWFFGLMILVGLMGCSKKSDQVEAMESQLNPVELQISVKDSNGKIRRFRVGEPVSVSRRVKFHPETSASNTFHLSPISAETFALPGQFTGDVDQGGSCNVVTLKYIPHTITHLETAAHVMSPKSNPPTILELEAKKLSGLLYLIDLTGIEPAEGNLIPWKEIKEKLKNVNLPISALALKTRASTLPENYDFSGRNFMALLPETAKGIHDYQSGADPSRKIECLVLDLPSIDPEKDEGKLLAHRAFFGLPDKGYMGKTAENRALVELAYFANLEAGYYYLTITPPQFQTNAVATGITLRKLMDH